MNIYLYVIVAMCGSFLLSVALLLFYLRYKKNLLHQQFQIQNAELEHQKKLTQVIIHSQEQERKRIGKELHDDVGNSLASLRLYLDKYMYVAAQENKEVREEYKKENIRYIPEVADDQSPALGCGDRALRFKGSDVHPERTY